MEDSGFDSDAKPGGGKTSDALDDPTVVRAPLQS
jgi:hypothetical protein